MSTIGIVLATVSVVIIILILSMLRVIRQLRAETRQMRRDQVLLATGIVNRELRFPVRPGRHPRGGSHPPAYECPVCGSDNPNTHLAILGDILQLRAEVRDASVRNHGPVRGPGDPA